MAGGDRGTPRRDAHGGDVARGSGVSRRTAVLLGCGVAALAGGAAVASRCARVAGSSTRSSSDSSASGATLDQRVSRAVASLTLEQKVAQMCMPTPEALTGVGQVTAAGETTRKAFASIPVGGLCYFSQNLIDPSQTKQMLASSDAISRDAVGLPLLMAVDEEGGTVSRIGSNDGFDVDNVGDMRDIGDAGDPQRAHDVCEGIAGYLSPLGFNLDLAPDADIVSGTSQTMARRSFGTSADVVAPMVGQAVRGFLDGGIMCCAKHFPGIGGAEGDSETEAIQTTRTLDQMRGEELLPFEEAIRQGVPMVMVGHLSCPAVTGDSTPASLSKAIVTDLLRDELGFDDIIITDSLQMGAVSGLYSASELGVAAIQAGVDMLLMTPSLGESYQGVLDAVSAGTLDEARIDESVTRIVRAKLRYAS